MLRVERPGLVGVVLGLVVIACAPESTPVRSTTSAPDAVTDAGAPGARAVPDDTSSSRSPLADPRDYLRVHNAAGDPESAAWDDAIATLAAAGDAFSLHHLASLDRQKLSEARRAALDRAVEAITARVGDADAAPAAAPDAPLDPSLVTTLLERAAYADLMCDPLEQVLPHWTFRRIGAHLDDPGVRAELQRLADGYTPTWELTTMFSSMKERVPTYATRVLAGIDLQPKTQ